MKSALAYNFSTAHQFSSIMILIVVPIKHLYLLSSDASHAYIHSEENLQPKVFVKACKYFGLERKKTQKLKKPLYGLTEIGYC